MDPQILMFIIKMVVYGIISFLAILVMSKTRAASWMFLVAGFLFSYAGLILDLMTTLGILSTINVFVFGIPLMELLSTLIPGLCFIISFILKFCKK